MLDPQASQLAHTIDPHLAVGPASPTAPAWAGPALAAPAPAPEVALAWLVFVGLLALALVAIPGVAALVRRGLPAARRAAVRVEPIAFGHSPRAQRSPRHPVRMHRTLLATALLALPALLLLLGASAIRGEGIAVVRGALALVLPTLLVTLHARRRSASP